MGLNLLCRFKTIIMQYNELNNTQGQRKIMTGWKHERNQARTTFLQIFIQTCDMHGVAIGMYGIDIDCTRALMDDVWVITHGIT